MQGYYSTKKQYSTRKKRHWIIRGLKHIFQWLYPKHQMIWQTEEPAEPAVFCCNHARAYGPLTMMLEFPRDFRPWVIGAMCQVKSAYRHIIADFWKPKNAIARFFVKAAAVLIAPILSAVMNGIEAIPVYYDAQVSVTFRKSVETLLEGKDIVIFPENSQPYTQYDAHFSAGFIQFGQRYYKKTGKRLAYYPIFSCKPARTVTIGEPMRYDPGKKIRENMEQIGSYLCSKMMEMAKNQMKNYEK